MRLIDADALIKRLNVSCKVKDDMDAINVARAFNEILDRIRNAPTIEAPEWIPCSERLPKGQGYYICTCKDGPKYKRTTVVKWSNGWQLTGSRAYWVVVAWMPLPQPWKGADDE